MPSLTKSVTPTSRSFTATTVLNRMYSVIRVSVRCTMNPETRTILKITLEDAEKADETFSILMGDKVQPRKEFIEKNAQFASNLDF